MLDVLEFIGVAGYLVDGILHVGANEGQERNDYLESDASPVIYVEPVAAVFDKLQANLAGMPGHVAVKAVCSEIEGESVLFNVADNGGQSSSLLGLGSHATFHPDISYTSTERLVTTTVDELVSQYSPKRVPNLLIVDAQGADLRVLQGAGRSLPHVDCVYIEVSEEPLYEGGCTLEEITRFLADYGHRMRWMSLDGNGHGNAFYARPKRPIEPLPTYGGNLALNKPAEQSSLSEWSYFLTANGPGSAVNGRVTGFFGFHTGEEESPWWQVDLGAEHALHEIRIYNRMDGARRRARSLCILVSTDGAAWTMVHDQAGYTFNGKDGRPLRVMVSGTSARYMRLQLNERNYFHLDQVEIY